MTANKENICTNYMLLQIIITVQSTTKKRINDHQWDCVIFWPKSKSAVPVKFYRTIMAEFAAEIQSKF